VVAVVSAALGCRDWRLVPSVAASLLAAGRVSVGVGVRPLERLGRSGGRWLLKGFGISYKLPLIHGAAGHHLKRNCLPLIQQPAGFISDMGWLLRRGVGGVLWVSPPLCF
jgi:hypothetical protein